jgi:hypothetical protein
MYINSCYVIDFLEKITEYFSLKMEHERRLNCKLHKF